jgi:hypothetical protein
MGLREKSAMVKYVGKGVIVDNNNKMYRWVLMAKIL